MNMDWNCRKNKDRKIRGWVVLSLCITLVRHATGTDISRIEPNEGSIAGETRVSIFGQGFSEDTYNEGNQVELVSDDRSYDCPVHKDGTTESIIMCYTPANMVEDYYWVRVKVDGVTVPVDNHCRYATDARCRFRVHKGHTPTVTSVEPSSGLPGSLIQINGRIFTDRYGSNVDTSSNGKTERILRVYAVSQECSLKYETDNLYGIELTLNSRGEGNDGYMKCKMNGNYVGNSNVSYIIEGAYGRSYREPNTLHVYSNDQIAVFQTYAEITSISPATGSIEGGTLVTITGNYFDKEETKAKTVVKIAGTDCEVQGQITDTQIICKTARKPEEMAAYPGNRGLNMEQWNDTSKSNNNLPDVDALTDSDPGYSSTYIDSAHFKESRDADHENFVSRVQGFFVPPKDGEYSFHILADDGAHLLLSNTSNPDFKDTIALSQGYSTNFFKYPAQASERITLTAGANYYLEVWHRQGSLDSAFKVAARYYDTHLTNHSSGMVEQEHQIIKITSSIVREIQNITFDGFTSTGGTVNEVQEVRITENSGAPSTATYRLGMYGVYTTRLTTSSSRPEIEAAIKALPIFQTDESVTVQSVTPSTGFGSTLTITFLTKRGNLEKLKYKKYAGSGGESLSVSITERTQGAPSGDYVVLKMNNKPSPLIAKDATAENVEAALTSMFGSRCPVALSNPPAKKKHYSYEENIPSHVGGVRYTEMEAFCGKAVIKNPVFLYRDDQGGLLLGQNLNTVCFAYYGLMRNLIGLSYAYTNSDGKNVDWETKYLQFQLNEDSGQTSFNWEYACYDIQTAIQNSRAGSTNIRLKRVQIFREGDGDIYIDEVYLGRSTTLPSAEFADINLLRLPPAKANNFMIDSVSVQKYVKDGNPVFEVELTPLDCGCNFPAFSTFSGQVKAGMAVRVQRPRRASCAIGGSFTVSFGGKSQSGISPLSTAEEFKNKLRAFPEMGNIYVYKHGVCDEEIKFSVAFLSKPGDQEKMQSTSQLTGTGVTIATETVTDGSVWFNPIQGDMLRTVHDKPQVAVKINTVPTVCSGDCTFEWTQAATPVISSINPTSGVPGSTTVTITGTGFDTTHSNNMVKIGGATCTPQSSTSTQIVCNVGAGSKGTYPVEVMVTGKGKSQNNNDAVTFTYQFQISSASPTTCSVGGGCTLTVTGYGFSSTDSVMIGTNMCAVTSFTPTQIECSVPANSAGAQPIKVMHSDNTESAHSASFTYTAAAMVITSSSPSITTVAGGDTLTLTGTGFDLSATLSVCGKMVTPTTLTSTSVVAVLPSNPPATCEIRLLSNNGLAVNSQGNIPTVMYKLKLNNVFPTRGSLYGGTQITLTGEGFSTDKNSTEIKIGSHDCIVDTATANQIECTIADTATTHKVDNSGVHYEFLMGYAWNPEFLKVKVGDIVEWSWSFADWVQGMKPKVEQVDCSDMVTVVNGGFSSGEGVARGVFSQRMVQSGDICISSGYIDKYRTTMFTMRISVESRMSSVDDVMLKVGDYEAVYDTASGTANPSDSSSCTGYTGKVSSCSDPEPSGGDPAKFNFKFYSCSTPMVTAVTPNSGTTDTTITITGTGFNSKKCRNEAKFGEAMCDASSSTDTKVMCTITPGNSPSVGVLSELMFRTHNLGNALVVVTNPSRRAFALESLVSSISPDKGSVAGATMVTITGSGFQGDVADVEVKVGGYDVTVKEVNYDKIVVETSPLSAGQKNVEVKVKSSSSQMVPAICGSTCKFTFDVSVTPEVSSVSPTTLTGASTTLTISGSKFGSSTQNADVTSMVGMETCAVTSVSDTSIECSITNIPVGDNDVKVIVAGLGKASGNVKVTGDKVISSISPSSGSTHGGTELVIAGNGFVQGSTSVSVDGTDCPVSDVTLSEVKCKTPAHADGAVKVTVTSSGQAYPQQDFTYSAASTPTIDSTTPSQGSAGVPLTITGSNFASQNSDNMVSVGGSSCSVTSSSASTIICTLGPNTVDIHKVVVHVVGKGLSNDDKTVDYQLSLTNISPTRGTTAGDQKVTITGSGLGDDTMVTMCGEECRKDKMASQTPSQYICFTPAKTGSTTSCDVTVTSGGDNQTLSTAYTYDASLNPTITSVNPTRGSSAGGTTLTITGNNFGTVQGDVSVSIADKACTISSISNTQIICVTGNAGVTVRSKVRLERNNNGIADQANADFHYVDVWSSVYTWGGNPIPTTGDLVVIQPNQSVLLDVDTPKLKMVLVNGGELIFDDKDLTLQAENILVVKGGLFQIGTEESPFQHQAKVILNGHHRTKELPIYGTKNLGIREGRLELHGKFVPITWTRLAATAAAGSTNIVVQDDVTWEVGDEIAIATTSHRHSQEENEKCTITAVGVDKRTITCQDPLKFEHLGVSETFDGTTLDFRAEVGLLTHNVKIIGSSDKQWEETIEACPDGFDTGEFAVQTCFQGRFGEELGSDQFGAHILIHAPEPDKGLVSAHIEYIEVRHAGQAFRLGRYPIHFHLNGDMAGSYVRGCGIHDTFNRAVNIHGTHNVLVERTVIYDIMGGAMFLEDGIETGNIFQYNLAIFVHMSSSLLNDDVTPAAFWVTNPNNTVQHNTAAGGSHFGFWYRMHEHPDGPSATTSVCGRLVELGVFFNNTVHSQGWFGLWIFETYTPKLGSACGTKTPTPAVFRNIFVWNCEKGVEFVNSGALQLYDSYLVNNQKAGFEVKLYLDGEQHTDNSLMLANSMIIGYTNSLTRTQQGCTRRGVVIGYGTGSVTKDVTFVNFDDNACATFGWARIDGTCVENCGGYTVSSKGLKFVNAPNKGFYGWTFEGQIKDVDGTLIGTDAASVAANVGRTVITCSDTLPPTCTAFPAFSRGKPACTCPSDTKFHRFAFNNIVPDSLLYKNIIVSNQYGNETLPYKKKSVSHPFGWHTVNVDGEVTELQFENAEHITNISYTGVHYEYNLGDYITFRQNIAQRPDRFIIDGASHINESSDPLNPASSCTTGNWVYDQSSSQVSFTVCGDSQSGRKKRSAGPFSAADNDRSMNFKAFKCFYRDCIPPPDPNTVPPVDERPDVFSLWSDTSVWTNAAGVVSNLAGSYGLPQDGDNVTILKNTWMVADTSLPYIHTLILYGGLELDGDGGSRDFTLNCTYLVILGGRLVVGWPNQPILSSVNIILRGSHDTPAFSLPDGPPVGSKAIGVFGGLDLHGIDVGVYWTTLASTASAGDNQVTLRDAVDWEVGSQIVIAPTAYKIGETEIFSITAVSIDKTVLTLSGNLQHKHLGVTETVDGSSLEMRAEVGLLTRNIKIIGEEYDQMTQQSFGARVIVGKVQEGADLFIGFARVSNVEFYRTSQEGWVESYDPRYSISFVDVGTVNHIKPSIVRRCAFHQGFGPAVGVYGTNNLPVEDNVAHGTVWYCMESNSDATQFRRNLCTHVQWEGSYQDRAETLNVRFNGAFNLVDATNLVLEGNHVAGTERVGFHVPPESCDSVSANPYRDNVAHTGLIGVGLFPLQSSFQQSCIRYSNFDVWRNADFGIYINQNPSSVISDVKSADNGVGIFTFVTTPAALSHVKADKTSVIKNSLLIGRSDSFDCANDKVDPTDVNIELSGQCRRCDTSRYVGVVMTSFMSGSNNAPLKPCCGIMTYQAIGGHSEMEDVTYGKFSDKCGSGTDVAFAPNNHNDDTIHPLEVRNISFINTPLNNKYRNARANLGKIDSSNCVDMACDGLLKVLVEDTDGSVLGSAGSIVSQSEFEYNGDRRRGLGDYRIPKEILTAQDGSRIPYRTLAPYQGIIRNSGATYRSAWQAYEVHDLTYRMLVVESLDSDTETRRLSPVAILGDGYIDLINGPQDHGWCSGYTCRKRVSTFPFLVATGKAYLMHYTSVSPQDSRFYLLNSQSSDAIVLSVWYSQPNRLDMYYGENYVLPKNGRMVAPPGEEEKLILDPPPQNDPDFFVPTVSDAPGTNFFNRKTGIFTFVIKGPLPFTIRTRQTIIVSHQFPPMSIADFFGRNIVQNLAAFLGIPENKVRVTDVIPENSSVGRRRRRATDDQIITGAIIEIGDNPPSNVNETSNNALTTNDLDTAFQKITNEIQLGNYSEIINSSSDTTVSIAAPPPNPDDPSWSQVNPDNSPYTILIQADSLMFDPPLTPLHEGTAFSIQPKVKVVDRNGNAIQNGSPWKMTATLRPNTGNANGQLLGNTTVNIVKGWANFTNLYIDYQGNDYAIDFQISEPAEGENFTIASDLFSIPSRPIKAEVSNKDNYIYDGRNLAIELQLLDEKTNEVIENINWRGHTWTVTASLGKPELYPNTTIQGTTQKTFNAANGRVTFDSIQISDPGMYILQFRISTGGANPDYDFTFEELVNVKPSQHRLQSYSIYNQVVMKFLANYNSVVGGQSNYFKAFFGYWLVQKYPNVVLNTLSVYAGSIVVSFRVDGQESDLNSTMYALCDTIDLQESFTYNGNELKLDGYLTVDGQTFYGQNCGSKSTVSEAEKKPFPLAIIIAVAATSVVLIVAVILFAVWKCKVRPRTKTYDINSAYGSRSDIDDILFREKTFMSIKSSGTPMAPAATNMANGQHRP